VDNSGRKDSAAAVIQDNKHIPTFCAEIPSFGFAEARNRDVSGSPWRKAEETGEAGFGI